MTNYVVETEQLTKKYKEQTIVNKIHLKVKEGDIYGFLGPNGAGKTTTIRMLLGLATPTSGNIYVFDLPLETRRIDILKHVGSLVESPSYYGHLTGYENLASLARILQVPQQRIEEVLEIVRLSEVANRLVKNYSLGMKQRLGIAAALLSKPKLLILDEPTNGLDPSGIQEIRELIKELPVKYGMTVIVSSHLLSEIDQMATQVGIINKGQLLFQDSIEMLRKKSEPSLKIGTDNLEEAKKFLQQKGIVTTLKEEYLWTPSIAKEAVSTINYELISAGYDVFELTYYKPSLEQIFLEITGKEKSL